MLAVAVTVAVVLAGCGKTESFAVNMPTPSTPSASPTGAARHSLWGDKPDTPYGSLPGADDTGQPIGYFSPSDKMFPAITNGLLVGVQTPGPEAWYRWFQERSPVTRLGVRWTVNNNGGALTTPLGVAALGLCNSSPADQLSGEFKLGAHFVLGPSSWQFQTLDFTIPASPVITTLAEGNYRLVQDGKTVYGAEMLISGDTATLLLPDGSVQIVTDHTGRMSAWSTGYGFIEQYAFDGATDGVVGFVEAWADTKPN